jgi:hypothetical protein
MFTSILVLYLTKKVIFHNSIVISGPFPLRQIILSSRSTNIIMHLDFIWCYHYKISWHANEILRENGKLDSKVLVFSPTQIWLLKFSIFFSVNNQISSNVFHRKCFFFCAVTNMSSLYLNLSIILGSASIWPKSSS